MSLAWLAAVSAAATWAAVAIAAGDGARGRLRPAVVRARGRARTGPAQRR